MDEWTVLFRVRLTPAHSAVSRTRHTVRGSEMSRPVELQIVKCSGTEGYYLFYCDETGKEMTDTYHDSVKEAMEQAEFEYGIKGEEWSKR